MTDTSGAAYPVVGIAKMGNTDVDYITVIQYGMTKREAFIKTAMIGILSSESEDAGVFSDIYADTFGNWVSCKRTDEKGVILQKTRYQCIAEEAVKIADACLAESQKEQSK